MFVIQRRSTMDSVFGRGADGDRPRTAMEVITNTHDMSIRKKAVGRKRRLSETVHSIFLRCNLTRRLEQISNPNSPQKNLISHPIHHEWSPKMSDSQNKSVHQCYEEAISTSPNISLKSVSFKRVEKAIIPTKTQLNFILCKLLFHHTLCFVMSRDGSRIRDRHQFHRD